MFIRFSTALSFLTVLSVPFTSPRAVTSDDLGRSFALFPVVGLLVGGCLFAPAFLFGPVVPPLILAVLLTGLLAVLTRGLHLDGLADLADGIGGGYTPERRLAIMKDSHTGAFGALALALAVLLKAAALHTLLLEHFWTPFLLVPILSREAMVLAGFRMPYARKEGGLGKPFTETLTGREVRIASVLTLALALPLAPVIFWPFAAVMLATVALLRAAAVRLLGGITGDVFGAVNEIVENVLFVLAACLAHA